MAEADHLPAAVIVTLADEPVLPAAADALFALFGARSIAVVGASADPTKLSGLALSNLLRCGFDGEVHAVNRRGITIDGIPTFRSILEINQPVDAGIVMVPAEHAVGAVTELGMLGTRVAVVAVSGFAELGTPAGRRLQGELVQAGHAAGVRIVGLLGGRAGCYGGGSLIAGCCSTLVISEQGRLSVTGPEVIETNKGVEEFDSRDRALVWRTMGGKHRYLIGGVDIYVDDDAGACRSSACALR